MKLWARGFEIVADLSQGLSQTPTRGHAEGFGGKVDKTDNQTRPNWNGATANERERVGVNHRIDVRILDFPV